MGSKTKGRATVRKGKKILQKAGWIFGETERTGKFIENKDLFGVIDNIAIKNKKWKLIQFKTNSRGVQKHFKAFAKKHCLKNMTMECWNWVDYKGFEILVWNHKGQKQIYSYIKDVDERVV